MKLAGKSLGNIFKMRIPISYSTGEPLYPILKYFFDDQQGSGGIYQGADNGLSIDPITGKIVLGNDFMADPAPATLLSSREIPLNNSQIYFTDTDAWIIVSPGGIIMLDLVNDSRAEMGFGTTGAYFALESDSVTGNPPRYMMSDISNVGQNATIQMNGSEFQITPSNLLAQMLTLDDAFKVYRIGDITGGMHLSIESGTGTLELKNDITGERIHLWDVGAGQVISGDVNNITTGAKETIDLPTGVHDFTNTAEDAVYSINGNLGITGVFANPTSITVEGGIITAAT